MVCLDHAYQHLVLIDHGQRAQVVLVKELGYFTLVGVRMHAGETMVRECREQRIWPGQDDARQGARQLSTRRSSVAR